MFEFLMLALAAENIAEILTNTDPLELGYLPQARAWCETNLGKFGKLATCKYCQMFWLCLLFTTAVMPAWFIACFALHRVCQFFSEFYERWMNRAPTSVFLMQAKADNSAATLSDLTKPD